MGTPLATRSPVGAEVEEPGGLPRHPKTGAPQVTDPSKSRKPKGKKSELIAKCEARGIEVPSKITVAGLQELLGPEIGLSWYGRPSSLGKQIENTTNLQKWSERAVALGVFLDPSLAQELSTLDPESLNLDDPEARAILDTTARQAKDTARAGIAAERGTHAHALTEDHDNGLDWIERARRGEDLGIDSDAQRSLVVAWEKMLAFNGLEILATEAVVVDDLWRQAGTLDRIARLTLDLRFVIDGGEIVTLKAGTVVLLDIKSGRLRCEGGIVQYWQGYAVQIASYAQSVPYDPATGLRGEWDFAIDQQWALIAHLDVLSALDGAAACRLVLVDLAAGREAGERCVWARSWERRRDVFSLVTDQDDTEVVVEVATPNPTGVAAPSDHATEVEQTVGSGSPPPDPAVELANSITDWGGELKKLLRSVWPVGLPTPGKVRSGTAAWNAEQLVRAQACIDEIVGPFPEPEMTPAIGRRSDACTQIEPVKNPDGSTVDAEALSELLATIKASSVVSIINGWLRESADAGCSWSPRVSPRLRQFEISRAALHLAQIVHDAPEDADDATFLELVRSILATALGIDPPLMLANPIGVVLAHLTIDEAIAASDAAQSLLDGRSVLTFSDQGHPVLTANPNTKP